MPLTPKDEISESRAEQQAKESGDEALAELRDRVEELDERTRGVQGDPENPHEVIDDMSEAVFGEIHDLRDRVNELEERVDRHETVLYDLIDVVQALGSASNWREFETGMERVEEEGSDAYPWRWDNETLGFKSERFE
jgi:predicted nuclease with TOPRIM domain